MANDEHLAILMQDVDAWNWWRAKNGEIVIDLRGANLIGAGLREANLSGVDLSYAHLNNADLNNAHLNNADLSNAYFNNADLSAANLRGTDLRGAGLKGAKFSGANLSGANLRSAKLEGANLSATKLIDTDLGGENLGGAKLINSNLIGAKLINSNLSSVDLINSNLSRANLSGANLSSARLVSAKLSKANFFGTNLNNADFTAAQFNSTLFTDTDLSVAKGLDSAQHSGPSYISIDTLYKSGGNIPESFLRGCGVPDDFITYARSLVGKAIDFYSCFISYSSKNQAFAERLYADLQSKGVRCWFAPEDLKIGEKIRVGIDESIRLHDKLLLVLSKHSVESEWVEKEVETAMEQERKQKRTVLFPVILDNAVMKIESGWPADIRRSRHMGDFRKWKDHDSYQKAFDRLLRDLKAEESK